MWPVLAVIISLCLVGFNQTDNNNFGSYRARWRKFETCKGPKQGECGNVDIQNTQNMSDVIFNLDFPKDCPVTKARVTAGTLQSNNSTKKLWNYSLDKPCQHFVLGPILVDSFNLTKNTCKIKKGQYTVHLNMEEKSRIFLGSKFFYGTYSFKTLAFNNINNFFCVYALLEAEKL
ncbi:uncharacterized protein [Choristoneura fumiferana]|uniref:uncharacterized protein n=1 Tax=Choristoneura fumiferana TaxID=7141 RepID=UPI003D154CAE